jgi:flagella basal body P-ring formation protein FlgA
MLVLFCAAGVAAFTASIGHRHAVLVVIRPVSAGATITNADLGEAHLPRDAALRTVPATQRGSVVGRVAGVNLIPGTLLAAGELSTLPQVDATHAVVGLALKDGQLPSGLRPLDPVAVVQTSPATDVGAGQATVLVDDAQVMSVATAANGQTTTVGVIVPRSSAPTVANAAALGQVSVILLGRSG